MTDFLNGTPGIEADNRKPWITPEIKELASAQDAQGGRIIALGEIVAGPLTYRPS